ncbi:MAG: L-fucose/L-arabinose isomerase family protein [Verrucomicrobia bacterium]|nr:L-fucose/L-arabinose isomerase family protein [Verrucomicrobiota bacterium]
MSKEKTTLGLIVGNRGFFPSHLCEEGRTTIINILKKAGFNVVALAPTDTEYGSVETYDDAKKCAELFKQHREKIDGVLVTLPNFGDERGVADTLKLANLNVPVLIHAFADDPKKMTIKDRRDSFCGKMSVCNNLTQYGIKYSVTSLHTVDPASDSFKHDLKNFGATCRIVRGLRRARIGAIGARPVAFNTVRYSEKLLERSGISVLTLDLYELFGWAGKLSDSDKIVKDKLASIKDYVKVQGVPPESLTKMAKLGVCVDRWMNDNELDATAIQCWTAMEEFFGVVPCTIMSMLSNALLPSACEVDIAGAVGMLAMRLGSGQPSALLDWNNNYGTDPDLCMMFHCSNLPKDVFAELQMDYQEIIAGTVGKENTYGTVVGRMKPGAFTYCRVSTDDDNGIIRSYFGEAQMQEQKVVTFGGYGVARIPDLQGLLRFICEQGFEHHVALNPSQICESLHDAFFNYLGWAVYYHNPSV